MVLSSATIGSFVSPVLSQLLLTLVIGSPPTVNAPDDFSRAATAVGILTLCQVERSFKRLTSEQSK